MVNLYFLALFIQIGISNSELSFNSPLLGGRQKFSCVPPGKGAAPDLQGVGTGSTGEDQTGSTWQPCQEGAQCINKSQICDGVRNCDNGRDENKELCDAWVCERGVRCQNSSVCIQVPHQTMCSGNGGGVCGDGSDQAYCLHTIYTGSFLNTSLGLRISNGEDCFCDLRDGEGARLFYRSMGRTHRSSHILGKVCIGRRDSRVCDGYPDCIHGADEDENICKQSSDLIGSRSGRKIEPESQVSDQKEDIILTQDVSEVDVEDEVTKEYAVDLNLLLIIFTITVVSVLGFCLLIIYVMFKLSRRNIKEAGGEDRTPLPPTFDRQTSAGSGNNIYVSTPRSPPVDRKPTWSLGSTCIVKELGRGFFSKVYLAQDPTHGLVALKTTDSQRTDKMDDCIANEIETLSGLTDHRNIIRLIGQNTDEKLIVLEYCFHGNLKDYVTRNREYFINELDANSGELQRDSFLYSSPTGSETFPMADFVTSLHTKGNIEDATCKDVPVVKMSKSLVSTRRLLYWSYQMSRGLRYLAEVGVIHRDVALRNMLLTNNDIIKISDFGLAASIDPKLAVSPNKTPQYWSRSNKPQPFKWMAPESFRENVFSQKTDVWAFGVTLWELFNLGKEPYGDATPHSLQKMLNTGGRLKDCSNAPTKVIQLMRECWFDDPCNRPNFTTVIGVLSCYIGRPEKIENDVRSRTDSGLGDVEMGYLDMTLTPRDSSGFASDSTPSTSKFSTRSREYKPSTNRSRRVSRSSIGNLTNGSTNSIHKNSSVGSILTNGSIGYVHSTGSIGSRDPNHNCSSPRAIYWSNYKIVNGNHQVYNDVENLLPLQT